MFQVHFKIIVIYRINMKSVTTIYSDILKKIISQEISYGKTKTCTKDKCTASNPLLKDHIPNKRHGDK